MLKDELKKAIIETNDYNGSRTIYQKFVIKAMKIGNLILTEKQLKNSLEFARSYIDKKLE